MIERQQLQPAKSKEVHISRCIIMQSACPADNNSKPRTYSNASQPKGMLFLWDFAHALRLYLCSYMLNASFITLTPSLCQFPFTIKLYDDTYQGSKLVSDSITRVYGLRVACVPSYCHISRARAITLSHAGSNTVYCPCMTKLLPAYGIRQNKRAWSCYRARLFSSLIGSNHDNGHVVCLKV